MKSLKINAIAATVVRILNIIFPLITGPYIARTLTKENIAIFDIANTSAQLFIPFATFGIYTFGVRAISKVKNNKQKINSLFSELFYLSIISTLITLSIYFLYIVLFIGTYNKTILYVYIILGIQISMQFLYIEWLNEAFENYTFIMYKTIIVRIAILILVFNYIKEPSDVIPYTIIVTIAEILNIIISFVWIKKEVKLVRIKITNIIKLIPSLFTILLLSNINMLYTYLDRIFLMNNPKSTYISDYMLANNIVMLIIGVVSGAISVGVPRLSYYLGQNNKLAYENLINKSSRLFLFFVIPISFGLIILGTESSFIYGGEKFITAGIVTSLFAFRSIIWALDNILGIQVMFVQGYEKQLTICITIGGLMNLGLNSLLFYNKYFLPEYYISTTIISEIIVLILYIVFIKKHTLIKLSPIFKTTLKYALTASSFIIISYLVNKHIPYKIAMEYSMFVGIIIKIILCSTIYIFILYLIKDVTIREAIKFIKKK